MDLVVVDLGSNDFLNSVADATVTATVAAVFPLLATAYPTAKLAAKIPAGQFKASAIKAGLPGNVKTLDGGSWMSQGLTNGGSATYRSYDGLHMSAFGQGDASAAYGSLLQKALGVASGVKSMVLGHGLQGF
jgi:hypothetical protein